MRMTTRDTLRNRLLMESLESRRLMAADAGVVELQPAVEISVYDQRMLELINRARSDPAAESRRQGIDLNDRLDPGTITTTPKPPLAPHDILDDVADAHTLDMLDRGFLAHTNPDGSGFGQRASAAGYSASTVGENIAARSDLSLAAASSELHDELFASPSHRENLFRDVFRDIGIGLNVGPVTYQAKDGEEVVIRSGIVTQVFGGGEDGFAVTGVAFQDDVVADDFFSIGEQRSGLRVEAVNDNGDVFATTTGTSGGYAIRLPTGRYTLTAYTADGDRYIDLGTVQIAMSNVKIDIRVEQLRDVVKRIELTGSGETLDMSDPAIDFRHLEAIDVRGGGGNTLMLAADRFPGPACVVSIIADTDDQIEFDQGWQFDQATTRGGTIVRRFSHDQAILELTGPSEYTNPIQRYDVDALDGVTANDALLVINELSFRRISDAETQQADPADDADLSRFKFFDVSADGRITAQDALLVINELGRRQAEPERSLGVIATPGIPPSDRSPMASAEREDVRPVATPIYSARLF